MVREGAKPLDPDTFALAFESLHTLLGMPMPSDYPRRGSS